MKNNPDHQPYDSTLKGLLEAEADGIIPYLVPGVRLKGSPRQAECNVELNRTTLSADKVYWAFYKDVTVLLHTELQVKPSVAFCRRILAYNGSLHNEFEVPVLSLVVYPFEYGSPDLFYEEKCADEVFASIRPKVILSARFGQREDRERASTLALCALAHDEKANSASAHASSP